MANFFLDQLSSIEMIIFALMLITGFIAVKVSEQGLAIIYAEIASLLSIIGLFVVMPALFQIAMLTGMVGGCAAGKLSRWPRGVP